MEPAPDSAPYRLDAEGRDHQGEYAALSGRGPVALIEMPGGLTAWAVTGFSELHQLLADPRIGKNARHWRAMSEGEVPSDWPLLGMITLPSMITTDDEDHQRLRQLINTVFTPRRVETLRAHVEQVTGELVDHLAALPTESSPPSVDLCEHFAYPLPMRVIGELLGVPPENRDALHAHSRTLASSSATPDQARAARGGLTDVMSAVVAERRRRPSDDLTSGLIALQAAETDRLSDAEVVGTLVLVLVAGHATTRNLIANAVRALDAHPEQLKLLCQGSRPWSAAVEETLRHSSPVGHFPLRFAREDIAIGGALIRKGDAVLASYSASGRDPRQFVAAQDFDVDRADKRHLSFGHGPHFCLGASMARMEAEVALRELYRRFPQLVVVGETTPIPSFVSNSVVELPVRWW